MENINTPKYIDKIKPFFSKSSSELAAYVFIFAGFVAFIILPIDYYYPETIKCIDITDLGELGTTLSGTSGILWALAGVILFFSALKYQREDLRLQREELSETRAVMKEQSETLKIQTAESTFFRLLENHRSLISTLTFSSENGYIGLTNFYDLVKNQTAIFRNSSESGEVKDLSWGSFYPARNMVERMENIEQIYHNSFHLIRFIQEKLDSGLFYHQTLYNSLSKAEKYILGLYILNVNSNGLAIFKNENFNYLEGFEKSGGSYYDKNTMPFFPYLSVKFINHHSEFSFRSLKKDDVKMGACILEIRILNNDFNHTLKLISIEFIGNIMQKEFTINEKYDIEIIDKIEVDLFNPIRSHIFSTFFVESGHVIRDSHQGYDMQAKFGLLYDNRNYLYTRKFIIGYNSSSQPGKNVSPDLQEVQYYVTQ